MNEVERQSRMAATARPWRNRGAGTRSLKRPLTYNALLPRRLLERILAGCVALLLFQLLATGAVAGTILPIDNDWSDEGGWHVYYNEAVGKSCFAETQSGDRTLLLGVSGEDGRLLFGFADEGTAALKPDSDNQINLSFAGRSSWTATIKAVDFGSVLMLFGGFSDPEFRNDLAAGSSLVARLGKRELASLSLSGTSAALKAIDACLAAMRAGRPETAPILAEASPPEPDNPSPIDVAAVPSADKNSTFFSVDQDWSNAGGWHVYYNDPDPKTCFAESRGADGALLLGMADDGRLLLGLASEKIGELKADTSNKVEISFNNRSSWTVNMKAVDFDGVRILFSGITSADDFRREIAAGSVIVAKINQRQVASLSLKGTSAALKAVDACLAAMLAGRPETAPIIAEAIQAPNAVGGANNDERLLQAIALYEDAGSQFEAGRHAEAERIFRQVLEVFEKVPGPESPVMVAATAGLAASIQSQGRYAEAEQLYLKVIASSSRVLGPEADLTLAGKLALAETILNQGRYSEAEQLYRQLLGVQQRVLGPEDPTTLTTIRALIHSISLQARFAEVEQLTRQVLESVRKVSGPEDPQTLEVMGALAQVLLEQGANTEGEQLHRQLLELQRRVLGPEHPQTLGTTLAIAGAINAQGRYAEAEQLYRQVLQIVRRVLGPEHPTSIATANDLANTLLNLGRFAEAEQLLRPALEAWRRVRDPNVLDFFSPIAAMNLARSLAQEGSYSEAAQLYRQAYDAGRRVYASGHPWMLNTLEFLAQVQVAQGSFSGAVSTWEEGFSALPEYFSFGTGTSFNEQHALLPLSIEGYLDAVAIPIFGADAASRSFEAQGWLTFGPLDVALADLGARRVVGSDAEARALRDLQQAREDLQSARQAFLNSFDQQAVTEEQRSVLSQRVSEAEQRYVAAGDYLSKNFPQLADLQLPRALKASEAQSLLKPGEGLVAYAATEKTLYAWLVTRDHIEWRHIPVTRADLAGKVARLRQSLDLSVPAAVDSVDRKCALTSSVRGLENRPFDLCLARDLHDLVLAFDLKDIDELIVVPDGPLEQLPFSLLVTDIDKDGTPHWLIEDHALSVLPGTSSLRVLRQAGAQHRQVAAQREPFLGVAPVTFDGVGGSLNLRSTAASLPKTKDEVTFISALLSGGPQSVVLGDKASEAFVRQAQLDRYRVISFATHALLSKEARTYTDGAINEPALLLRAGGGQDGLLTATEVASLRLDADWVLLSACNTGAGGGDDAEGLSGLARAFFFAGARSLLVSNWSVDDSSANELMIQTMQNSVQRKMTRAQALRQAILNVMQSPDRDFKHPFFWAAFNLVGEN